MELKQENENVKIYKSYSLFLLLYRIFCHLVAILILCMCIYEIINVSALSSFVVFDFMIYCVIIFCVESECYIARKYIQTLLVSVSVDNINKTIELADKQVINFADIEMISVLQKKMGINKEIINLLGVKPLEEVILSLKNGENIKISYLNTLQIYELIKELKKDNIKILNRGLFPFKIIWLEKILFGPIFICLLLLLVIVLGIF